MEPPILIVPVQQSGPALREALSETEELCRAIQQGQVDAVVVGETDEARRVLLMSDAYERYRRIVDDMQQGALTLSPSGEILYCNHGFARLLGEAPGHVVNTSLESWVVAEDAERARALATAPAAGELDMSLLPTSGPRTRVRACVVSASDDFVTAIFTDLTPQAAQEEAQAALEAIRSGKVDAFVVDGSEVVLLETAAGPFRELVDRMRHGAVTISDECRVTYFNARLRSMLRATREALAGRPVEELVVDADRARLAQMCASTANMQAELRLRCADGRTLAVHAAMVSYHGQRMFLFTDLSEQKRHLASDELTRKFLGLLAEEFHEMLGTIDASARRLRGLQALPGEGREALDAIERTTRLMGNLVEDLGRINPRE